MRLKLARLKREEFHVIWLNSQNRVIRFKRLAVGTLSETHIYPREVVKQALKANAAAAIFAHNHPSGDVEPCPADIALTDQLRDALRGIAVTLHDHFVVGSAGAFSIVAKGMVCWR